MIFNNNQDFAGCILQNIVFSFFFLIISVNHNLPASIVLKTSKFEKTITYNY